MASILSNTPFQNTLLPASFGGFSFYVVDTSIRSGLRVAVHEYPMRNTPYAEPLGKQARQYVFDGFLVAVLSDGTDLSTQYDAFLRNIEENTPKTLIHPTLGIFQAVCVGAEFSQNLAGRYVEMRLSFVEAGEILNPDTGPDTQDATLKKTDAAETQSTTSFSNDVQQGNSPSEGVRTFDESNQASTLYNDFGDRAAVANTTGFA